MVQPIVNTIRGGAGPHKEHEYAFYGSNAGIGYGRYLQVYGVSELGKSVSGQLSQDINNQHASRAERDAWVAPIKKPKQQKRWLDDLLARFFPNGVIPNLAIHYINPAHVASLKSANPEACLADAKAFSEHYMERHLPAELPVNRHEAEKIYKALVDQRANVVLGSVLEVVEDTGVFDTMINTGLNTGEDATEAEQDAAQTARDKFVGRVLAKKEAVANQVKRDAMSANMLDIMDVNADQFISADEATAFTLFMDGFAELTNPDDEASLYPPDETIGHHRHIQQRRIRTALVAAEEVDDTKESIAGEFDGIIHVNPLARFVHSALKASAWRPHLRAITLDYFRGVMLDIMEAYGLDNDDLSDEDDPPYVDPETDDDYGIEPGGSHF